MDTLPDELIVAVLSHLEAGSGQEHYLNVAQVCRRLNSIVTPILYSHCIIDATPSPTRLSQVYGLIAAIDRNPQLGLQTRQLSVCGWVTSPPRTNEERDTCMIAQHLALKHAKGVLALDTLLEAHKTGLYDAAVATLLCLIRGCIDSTST